MGVSSVNLFVPVTQFSESLLTNGFAFRMFISTARRLRVLSSSDLSPSSVSHTCRAESILC